jgi:hypothetical protein
MGNPKYALPLKMQAAAFAEWAGFFAVRFMVAAGRFASS